ncbi:MAG TPA: hypothetical protein PKU97_21805 [Kofleriaceae bacterium]|nr:hypothetical protein [Kofleriaceae bacterium]
MLCGSSAVRRGIDAGATLAELVATWADDEASYAQWRRDLLLYA